MLPAVGASAASEAVAGAGVPVACSVAGATDGSGSGAGFLERISCTGTRFILGSFASRLNETCN